MVPPGCRHRSCGVGVPAGCAAEAAGTRGHSLSSSVREPPAITGWEAFTAGPSLVCNDREGGADGLDPGACLRDGANVLLISDDTGAWALGGRMSELQYEAVGLRPWTTRV